MYTNYIITAIGIIIIYNHVIFRLSKKDKLTDSNSISKSIDSRVYYLWLKQVKYDF